MISLARYTALLRGAEVRRTYAVSIVGRLPIGITGLAILLLAQGYTGSFTAGGAASGFYVAGLAAMAPAVGRIIDRYGPRLMLLASAVLFPTALVSLVLAARAAMAVPVLFALAAVAGAVFPPITVCMRTYLKRRFTDEGLLAAAYSLESVLIELIFIVGPLLVALFVAAATPAAAVLFAALTGACGTVLFLRSPALRAWTIEPRTHGSLLGPLANGRFAWLFLVILAYSTAFGLMEIAVAAFATHHESPALAGVLLGIMSAGSALGGIAYGSRTWGLRLARQFALALALMGVGLGVLALGWRPAAFALWCAIAGVIMAPALIMQAMLVARIASAEHSTEAFTWSTSALLSGVGVGLAAGGSILDFFDYRAAMGAAAATAVAAALIAAVTLARD